MRETEREYENECDFGFFWAFIANPRLVKLDPAKETWWLEAQGSMSTHAGG